MCSQLPISSAFVANRTVSIICPNCVRLHRKVDKTTANGKSDLVLLQIRAFYKSEFRFYGDMPNPLRMFVRKE